MKEQDHLYTQVDPDKMILRDHLAKDRTALANERTMLAYARTAIMIFASAITLIKLFPESPGLIALGYVFIPIGLFTIGYGYCKFLQEKKSLELINKKSQ